MSEYQFIAFRAVDAPLSPQALAYMREQSTRAQITPWSFTNEYRFGDFRGNVMEMLRRGYDLYLQYANYGVRSLCVRLPQGFPDPRAAEPYMDDEAVQFVADQTGSGGSLIIQPYYDPGDVSELTEVQHLVDELVPLREEILHGDLRPLYLAHLAASLAAADEVCERPVPAGLGALTAAQRALAAFYELPDALLAAAAQASPPLPSPADQSRQYASWLAHQIQATKDAWLAELMTGSPARVRRAMLDRFRADGGTARWPTVTVGRRIDQLQVAAEQIREESRRQAIDKLARERAERLTGMAADPAPYLREAESLVACRSTQSYATAARILAEVREATVGTVQSGLAARLAQRLNRQNPKSNHLTAALRKEGFLPR